MGSWSSYIGEVCTMVFVTIGAFLLSGAFYLCDDKEYAKKVMHEWSHMTFVLSLSLGVSVILNCLG